MKRIVLLQVATVMLLARTAYGHVAPSVDDNNRYLKLTPMSDRVRLAYTVFMGQVPGAAARRQLDSNHDGKIADVEAQTFGVKLGDEVRNSIELTVDGVKVPITWTTVSVGMGSTDVNAGAFSIDLIAWVCLPKPGAAHEVTVRDGFIIARPGETELKIEDSLGIAIDKASLGGVQNPEHDFRLAGAGGPLASEGLQLGFTVGPDAPGAADGTCKTTIKAGVPPFVFVFAGGLVATVMAAFVVIFARRSAKSAS